MTTQVCCKSILSDQCLLSWYDVQSEYITRDSVEPDHTSVSGSMFVYQIIQNYQCLNDLQIQTFNPIALRTAKTLWSFGRSECNRVKYLDHFILGYSEEQIKYLSGC